MYWKIQYISTLYNIIHKFKYGNVVMILKFKYKNVHSNLVH